MFCYIVPKIQWLALTNRLIPYLILEFKLYSIFIYTIRFLVQIGMYLRIIIFNKWITKMCKIIFTYRFHLELNCLPRQCLHMDKHNLGITEHKYILPTNYFDAQSFSHFKCSHLNFCSNLYLRTWSLYSVYFCLLKQGILEQWRKENKIVYITGIQIFRIFRQKDSFFGIPVHSFKMK